MTGTCVGEGGGFISSVAAFVDCQAQILGSGAWAALSAPGSSLMVALTGFLTIFIALTGYNLLLGATMTVRSATMAFVKIGAVFALATSWPAYRTLVYDLVVDGPGQLVREIGPTSGVVGSDGSLLQRLDLTDQGLSQLAILGADNGSSSENKDIPPPPFGGFDAFALGGSRILFLLTAIAGLTVVRVVAGLMLALGPFFIAFLMFDSTRGLFEGWVRILGGAALASAGASVALGLELALLDPWLSDVLARRAAGESLPNIPTDLFVLALLFACTIITTLYACARLAHSFRLPPVFRTALGTVAERRPLHSGAVSHEGVAPPEQVERTRAAAIANIIARTSYRETARVLGADLWSPPAPTPDVRTAVHERVRAVPLGNSFSRRPTAHVSARAIRRDQGQ